MVGIEKRVPAGGGTPGSGQRSQWIALRTLPPAEGHLSAGAGGVGWGLRPGGVVGPGRGWVCVTLGPGEPGVTKLAALAHRGPRPGPHPLAVVPPADSAGRVGRVKRTGFALDAAREVCPADGRDDGEEWEARPLPSPSPKDPRRRHSAPRLLGTQRQVRRPGRGAERERRADPGHSRVRAAFSANTTENATPGWILVGAGRLGLGG